MLDLAAIHARVSSFLSSTTSAMSDEKPDKPCTLTLEDGTHFDLNPLSSAKQDYVANSGNNDTIYKLNVCRSVVDELWNIDDPDKVGGVVKRKGGEHHGDFSLG